MGLLDDISAALPGSLSSDADKADAQRMALLSLGAGLLGARTSNFGTALGQGMQNGIAGYQAGLAQQREQMQTNLLKQQIASATRKNNLINDMIAQYGGGGSSASPISQALQSGAAAGSIGPTNVNAARIGSTPTQPTQPAQPGVINGVPTQAIAHDLAFNDGKNIGEWMYKQGVPDMQVSNGYAYDKNKLPQGFLPSVNVSQNGQATITLPDGKGGVAVSAPSGALDTYQSYRTADERAKGNYNFTTMNLPTGPRLMTTSQAADFLNGSQPTANQPSAAKAPAQTPANWRQINADSKAGQPQRDSDRTKIIQDEWRNEKDPAKRAMIEKDMKNNGIPIPGVQLQTDAEKEKQVGQVRVGQAVEQKSLERFKAESDAQEAMLNNLNVMERLAKSGIHGTGAFDQVAMAAHARGMNNSDKAMRTARFRQLGEGLITAHGLGQGVSNADVTKYEAALGRLNNPASEADALDAIKIMREIGEAALERTRQHVGAFNSTGEMSAPTVTKKYNPKTGRIE